MPFGIQHVDIVIPGEGLLGVSGPDKSLNDPGGVLIRSFNPWPYLRPPKTVELKTDKEADIIAVARTQIGKPFDNTALWDFLSDSPGDRNWKDEIQLVLFGVRDLVLYACWLFPLSSGNR